MQPLNLCHIVLAAALFLSTGITYAQDPISMSSMRDANGELVLLPSEVGGDGAAMISGVRMTLGVEAGYRVYQAQVADKTHRAHVALNDQATHLAFDTSQMRFRRMLPSIRIELKDYGHIDEIVEAAGGTSGKVYASLGFALISLPKATNPANAVRLIQSQPNVMSASIRLEQPLIIPM